MPGRNYIYDNATFIQGVPVSPTFQTAQPGQTLQINAAGQLVAANPTQPLATPSNVPIGGVALSALGVDTVNVAGTIYVSEFDFSAPMTVTGLALLNGSTVGTDNNLVALFSSTGARLATSALAGALSAGANVFQRFNFTAPLQVLPGRYFAAFQSSGTTAKVRKNATLTYLNLTISQVGVFGTVPAQLTAVPTAIVDGAGGFFYAFT